MKEKLINMFRWVMGKNTSSIQNTVETSSNSNTRLQQLKILLSIVLIAGLIVGGVMLLIKKKAVNRVKAVIEESIVTHELADKTLDPEKHWRNYFEEKQEQLLQDVDKRLKDLTEQQDKLINQTNQRIEEELAETKEKLAMAQQELASASLDLQRVANNEYKQPADLAYITSELATQDFDYGVEFDKPKSAKNYIPEGTYFTGHLLGGIAVSTGLNTPEQHATPVTIQLIGRLDSVGHSTTNLSSLNKLVLENCRIQGSSYGDLSSERAIVRLEKMVCEQDGVYITSKIAGQIFGSDGLNGVKGTVIATSSKHLKNAAIGGLISGISSAAKGQESSTITASGLIQTPQKGVKTLLGSGALQGSSNAGDKIADYYLRQAEAMSPILTVPSGVRINAQITKGFFVGEISTHKKIKAARANGTVGSRDIKDNIKSGYEQ